MTGSSGVFGLRQQQAPAAVLEPVLVETNDGETTNISGYVYTTGYASAVAISGDGRVIAIGAYYYDTVVYSNCGCVYIYDRSPVTNTLTLRSTILVDVNTIQSNAHFGSALSLSTDGDTVIVGSDYWRDGTYEGTANVYGWISSTQEWVQKGQMLAGYEGQGYAYSGVSISGDGNRVAVGALGGAGFVRIYDYNNVSGTWDLNAHITATDGIFEASFGTDVDLSVDGNQLMVCSVGYHSWRTFTYTGGTWVQDPQVVWSPDTEQDPDTGEYYYYTTIGEYYACAGSVNGDLTIAAIGAMYYTDTLTRQGGVYLYYKNQNTNLWEVGTQVLMADDPQTYAYYGRRVELCANENLLLVGSTGWDGAYSNQGKFYLYELV